MSNAYIHPFREQHQYFSFYPYYLPSYYSNYYPRHYNRYYEPVNHVTAKLGTLEIQDTTVDIFNMTNLVKLVAIVVFFMLIARALFKR